ncbi:hypothetical protein [Fictibacillus sp. S7]|uniref:hypothetical protein n=1 Tax=Fictibacillus sp. S7 TaxID=2212476 RepID=UPI0010101144|nr:hypothetical protein [Fictibacillus sp. S7]RXY98558.1 hypothetical protein DMO16_02120 [Fictibacillus sp. S7]
MKTYIVLPNDKRLSFAEKQAKKEEDIERALLWIKAVTEGKFTAEMEFVGTETQWKNIIQVFNKVSKILFSSNNNNMELISRFLVKRYEFSADERYVSLARVVKAIHYMDAHERFDTGEGQAFDDAFKKDSLVWEQIIRRAEQISN